ncbi:MAG: 4'-phosphopantetheinyl transferase superfamily protein [Planctomycetota bacterium]
MDDPSLHDRLVHALPGGTELAPNEVHTWAVPLVGDGERFLGWLSPAEREKASRFRFADHTRRFAVSHGALRAILAGYVGADPAALEFTVGGRGKPALAGEGMPHFNLSHSAQLALVAVSHAPVGVDVEKLRHLERLRDIARRQFSTAEIAAFEQLPEGEQLQAFYRCWTRKEAYVKALGLGLAALDVFDVELGERARFTALRDGEDVAQWSLFDVSPALGYVGALAVRDPRASVRQFRLGDL